MEASGNAGLFLYKRYGELSGLFIPSKKSCLIPELVVQVDSSMSLLIS